MSAPVSSDIRVGTALPERRHVIRAEAMKVFSLLTDDPNPIHWDAAAVAAQGLGDRPVNQGGLNAGYALQAATAWAGGPSTLRRSTVRFLGAVHAGDTVVSGGEITAVETTATGEATVTVAVWLRTPGGSDVVSGSVVVVPYRLRTVQGGHDD